MTFSLRSSLWMSIAVCVLLVIPLITSAANANELIKCDKGSEVYLLGEDGKRYSFPNEKIYFSWYEDFSEIKEVSCDDLAAVPFGGVVKYRPGMRLIKMPSVPRVYAVESNGTLRPIKNEDQAKTLYGTEWAKKVDDLPESFFPRYRVGEELKERELPEGMVLKEKDGNLVQVDDDGELVEVTSTLSAREKSLLRRHASNVDDLEARLGKALDRIRDLEEEIERLQRQLQRTKAVTIDEQDKKKDVVVKVKETRDTEKKTDGMPDLTVSGIALTESGAGSVITATIKNQGTVDAPTDTQVYFWLDGVLEWTYNTVTLADRTLLKAGGSSTVSPQAIQGNREVKVCVDTLNSIKESDESNNCKSVSLSAKDGDFDLTVTSVDTLDALGKKDEAYRSFGFKTSGPLDHYRIRIWDAQGKLHDEFVQQIIGETSVTSFYVSPSWLTPLKASTRYTYEVHAEEYGTGDADTEKGEFTTAASPIPLGLNVTYVNTAPHASATVSPGTDATLAIYELEATGGDVWMDQMFVTALVQDTVLPSGTPFAIGVDGTVKAQDYLTSCRLIDTATQNVLSGPVGMYGPYPNQIYFYTPFKIAGGTVLSTVVRCKFSSLSPVKDSDAFAVTIPVAADVIANENSLATGHAVPVTLVSTNGNPPNFYTVLQ